jgi:hypothetical protein
MTMAEEVVLVCARATARLTVQGSTFDRHCELCGERVMVSPGGQKALREGRVEKIQCNRCVEDFMSTMTAEQITNSLVPEGNITIIPNLWRERN